MLDAVGFIGRFAIIAGFVATSAAAFAFFLSLRREGLLPLARAGFHLTTTSIFVASAALLTLIITHQFQFHYVWAYSARDLPFGLLMSTFYAGQEGSFLLWTFMVAVIGIVLMAYSQKHDNEREVMGMYATILGFLMLLLVVKNPFSPIDSPTIPLDGKGLNPLLQNFWMQIHPPILFLGFAAMTPPFALGMAALMQKKYQDWVTGSLPWVVGGAMVLGLGIALGGFWAYETLGWGGWWGWDPVENSSLIPWIVSVALVHTMLTQKRTKGLVMTNFLLASLSFVLVLYSTFLTRSGVLGDASVHSFVDPGRFAFTLLVLFMFVFIDIGIALLFIRFTRIGVSLAERVKGGTLLAMVYLIAIFPSIPIFATVAGDLVPVFTETIEAGSGVLAVVMYPLLGIAHLLNILAVLWIPALLFKLALIGYTITGRLHSEKSFTSFKLMSRETFLGFGSATLGVLTIIVLLGTSLPIIPQSITGGINDMLVSAGSDAKLGNTVEPAFYDSMGLPLGVLLAGLAAFALLLKWVQNDGRDVLKRALLPAGIAIAATAAVWLIGGVTHPWMLALAWSSFFSLIVNGQVGYKILRGNPKFTGAYIAHIGIASMLLGIIGSGYMGTKTSIELPQGVTKSALGYNFTYTGYEPFWNGERFYFNVKLSDSDNKELDVVQTIMFNSNYGGQEQRMRNPGIAKFLLRDVYIEPQAIMAPDPEGWQYRQLTKGASIEAGPYRILFLDYEMNNSRGAQAFTIGGVFEISKNGGLPQQVTVTRTQGPDDVTNVPATVTDGDLELAIEGMTPNREDLAMSVLDIRFRNPREKPDPSTLRETLVVEASVKPFISIVWLGIILMVVGFGIARFRRAGDAKRLEAPSRPGLPPGSVRHVPSTEASSIEEAETEKTPAD